MAFNNIEAVQITNDETTVNIKHQVDIINELDTDFRFENGATKLVVLIENYISKTMFTRLIYR